MYARPCKQEFYTSAITQSHQGTLKVDDCTVIFRCFSHWPSMFVDCYGTMRNCVTCARNGVIFRQYNKPIKAFPALAPMEFVAINILGALVTTPRKNRYQRPISDRFSKIVRTVLLRVITAEAVSKAFLGLLLVDPREVCFQITGSSSDQGCFNMFARSWASRTSSSRRTAHRTMVN